MPALLVLFVLLLSLLLLLLRLGRGLGSLHAPVLPSFERPERRREVGFVHAEGRLHGAARGRDGGQPAAQAGPLLEEVLSANLGAGQAVGQGEDEVVSAGGVLGRQVGADDQASLALVEEGREVLLGVLELRPKRLQPLLRGVLVLAVGVRPQGFVRRPSEGDAVDPGIHAAPQKITPQRVRVLRAGVPPFVNRQSEPEHSAERDDALRRVREVALSGRKQGLAPHAVGGLEDLLHDRSSRSSNLSMDVWMYGWARALGPGHRSPNTRNYRPVVLACSPAGRVRRPGAKKSPRERFPKDFQETRLPSRLASRRGKEG